MIKKLIDLNLKGTNNKKHIIFIVIVAISITHIKLNILSFPHSKNFCIGDIAIFVFGGLDKNFNLVNDFSTFLVWSVQTILIIYLTDICINDTVKRRATLVLPRVRSKAKWFIAFNVANVVVIIKYYLVLYVSCLGTIFVKMGPKAFKNIDVLVNEYNYLGNSFNQYELLMYMFIMNILTIISLMLLMNNLYYIFWNSEIASVMGILICFFSVLFTKNTFINKFSLLNHGMLRRHNIFRNGFDGFSIKFSMVYLILFIVINFIIGMIIIKKRDTDRICG